MQIDKTIEEGIAVIAPHGKLTVQTSPELEEAVGLVLADSSDLDIDLSDVTYISSAGLRVIVAAGKSTAGRGGRMRLLHPMPDVMDVFEMTGLADILDIEQ